MFRVAFFALLSTAATLSDGFVPRQASIARGGSFHMSTETQDEKKVEGKKAGKDAPPVNIGWDSHKAVVSIFPRLLDNNFKKLTSLWYAIEAGEYLYERSDTQ